MTIFSASCYGDSERNLRLFEATLLWGFGEVRTAGKRRERDRVREREIPDFPKTRAHALRFGSMNPISSLYFGHGSGGGRSPDCNFPIWGQESVEKCTKVVIPNSIWTESYKVRGVTLLSTFIEEMEFRPITGWPKRASYGE